MMIMPSPRPPDLEGNDVHVWRCRLSESAGSAADLLRLLSSDERERADRFRVEHARAQYVVTRSALRSLLGAYLRTPPDDLRFTYTDRGKPCLDHTSSPIAFNVAHSREICLIALASSVTVGVDVEEVRLDVDF